MALAQQTIMLEDAIDLREIKNLKLANQLLKIRRKQKQEKDHEMKQANIQAQANANAQAQQAAAQAEVQKNKAITQLKTSLEQIKAQLDVQNASRSDMKKQLMQLEFEYNMQLRASG